MKKKPTRKMLILLKKEKNYKEISEFCNCSLATVNRWYKDEGFTKKYKARRK